ncbi:hypothetical protein Bbelb_220410 [Branchiostoma belcheri]|nr:hypothetical protein Bbelb_220410 [Branchiostoma belcheri]
MCALRKFFDVQKEGGVRTGLALETDTFGLSEHGPPFSTRLGNHVIKDNITIQLGVLACVCGAWERPAPRCCQLTRLESAAWGQSLTHLLTSGVMGEGGSR